MESRAKSKLSALIYVALFVMCLLGVVFGAVSQISAKPSNLLLLGINCIGAVIFAVSAVRHALNALRCS